MHRCHRSRWMLVVFCVGIAIVDLTAMKRFQQPSRSYDAGTNIYNIPPAANRKYVGVQAELTREAWPGVTTLAAPITTEETVLLVLLGTGDANFPSTGVPFTCRISRCGAVRLVVERLADGVVEGMWLDVRAGDTLAVHRRDFGRHAFPAGSTITLLNLVYVEFQAALDGVTWSRIGAADFTGGVVRNDMGVEQVISSVGFGWTDGTGARIARDGDTRVSIRNSVALRTALTLDMTETTDPLARR